MPRPWEFTRKDMPGKKIVKPPEKRYCQYVVPETSLVCNKELGVKSNGKGSQKYCFLHKTAGLELDKEIIKQKKKEPGRILFKDTPETVRTTTCELETCKMLFTQTTSRQRFCGKKCAYDNRQNQTAEYRQNYYKKKREARTQSTPELIITHIQDNTETIEDIFA